MHHFEGVQRSQCHLCLLILPLLARLLGKLVKPLVLSDLEVISLVGCVIGPHLCPYEESQEYSVTDLNLILSIARHSGFSN